ncbi:alpha/beta hydrolase [Microbacterium sp. ARD32]|uniref:alpha/beta hydrolase family protein n=1 Tax=Microbacterium sp. ARD32 TaxID=2962577 RepID=UPI00288113F6|nr:alpha/beta hydrolase [Microbacterium sp. ARD32]MDT0157938.1 alpha/beta hydrolase [Microbacterium sp. ARD32]
MPALMSTVATGIRMVGAVSPALAGRLAVAAFFSTSPRMPVRGDDRHTHHAAERGQIEVDGQRVTTYQWGRGTRTALIMHGWNSRAAQFATLVRELVSEGFRVVGFDAPANGDSTGRRTDVRDWVAAARILGDAQGPFDLIVGHSFGGFAALAAVRDGVHAPRVVIISAAGTVQAFHDQFQRMLRLSPRTATAFEHAFYRRMRMDRADAEARYDSLRHPLPHDVELLIAHDALDHRLDPRHSHDLHAAHDGHSRLVVTEGFGHNRTLRCDPVLDAVLEFVRAPRGAASSPAR